MQSSHASTCVFKLVAPTVRTSDPRPRRPPSVEAPTYASHVLLAYRAGAACAWAHVHERGGGREGGTRGVHKPACIQIKLPEKLLISGPIATGPFISGPRASLSAPNSLNIGRPLTCQNIAARHSGFPGFLEISGGFVGGREGREE